MQGRLKKIQTVLESLSSTRSLVVEQQLPLRCFSSSGTSTSTGSGTSTSTPPPPDSSQLTSTALPNASGSQRKRNRFYNTVTVQSVGEGNQVCTDQGRAAQAADLNLEHYPCACMTGWVSDSP